MKKWHPAKKPETSYVIYWASVDTSFWDDGNRTKRYRRECADLDEVKKEIEKIYDKGHIMDLPVVERVVASPLTKREREKIRR